jgi:hypothetical protein
MRFNITLLVSLLFVVVESPGGELELAWLEEIPPPLPSSLGIMFGVDDADGWSRQLNLSLAAPLATRFNLAIGERRVESDEAQLQTDNLSLSLSTDPLEALSITLGYEDWGDDDALTIKTRWFGLGLNLGDFHLSLMPQQRDIRLQVYEWFHRYVPHIDLESRDIGLWVSYFGPEDWVFNASYFKYDYSKDVSRLDDNFRVIFIFPLNALDLASGLDEYRYSLGIGKFIDNINIDLDWSRSRSAVDKNDASVTSLSVDFPLSDQFSLNLIGGMQEVDYSEDRIIFANLGATLSW